MQPHRDPRQIDLSHIAAIKRLPCIIPSCNHAPPSEAAHISLHSDEHGTVNATSMKAHDHLVLPLCHLCHRVGRINEGRTEHVIGSRAFWDGWDFDPFAIAKRLHELSPDITAMEAQILRFKLFRSLQ